MYYQLFSVCLCTEQRQLLWKQHRQWQLRWRYFHHPLCWSLEVSVASQHGLSLQLSRRTQQRRSLPLLQVRTKIMHTNLQAQKSVAITSLFVLKILYRKVTLNKFCVCTCRPTSSKDCLCYYFVQIHGISTPLCSGLSHNDLYIALRYITIVHQCWFCRHLGINLSQMGAQGYS